MIGVIAKLSIHDGKNEQFVQVVKDLMTKVKANEPGCLTYQLYKSKKEANTYIFMEQYASQADLESHGQTEYFKAAGPGLGACLAGAPEISYFDSID